MSGVQKNNNILLNTILIKFIAALCITGTCLSTIVLADDVKFSRSILFENVLTDTNWGNVAIVDINRDGKADIVLDNSNSLYLTAISPRFKASGEL